MAAKAAYLHKRWSNRAKGMKIVAARDVLR